MGDAIFLAGKRTTLWTMMDAAGGGPGEDPQGSAGGAGEVEGEVSAPLVFQCKACRVIVGDSFSWVCSDQALNTVTLNAIFPNVNVAEKLETQTTEPAIGSTFWIFHCLCGAQLGRMYKTTPRSLDHIRDLMTYDLDAITSYQLGTATALLDEGILDLPSASGLQEQVYKVQTLILALNERIQALEDKDVLLDQERSAVASSAAAAASMLTAAVAPAAPMDARGSSLTSAHQGKKKPRK